jgi:hypothetical protein
MPAQSACDCAAPAYVAYLLTAFESATFEID